MVQSAAGAPAHVALDALGTSFRGAMYVTPSAGVQVVGAIEMFWPGEGRAAGYAGVAVP